MRGDLFLDIFGGTAGVAKAVSLKGPAAYVFDLTYSFDILKPRNLRALLDLIAGGRVRGVCLASPCETFSAARRAPRWSSYPSALRSKEHILGLSGLNEREQFLCEQGNQLMLATARIARACIKYDIPWVLENPLSSLIWLAPPISRLLSHANVQQTIVHQCQYGTPWKKPTRLYLGGLSAELLSCTCRQKGKTCSATGKPHYVLSGTTKSGFRTQAAKEYPSLLCAAIANSFATHWRNVYIARRSSLLLGTA
jgi:hypothetical protein